jgi:hypothetical protein
MNADPSIRRVRSKAGHVTEVALEASISWLDFTLLPIHLSWFNPASEEHRTKKPVPGSYRLLYIQLCASNKVRWNIFLCISLPAMTANLLVVYAHMIKWLGTVIRRWWNMHSTGSVTDNFGRYFERLSIWALNCSSSGSACILLYILIWIRWWDYRQRKGDTPKFTPATNALYVSMPYVVLVHRGGYGEWICRGISRRPAMFLCKAPLFWFSDIQKRCLQQLLRVRWNPAALYHWQTLTWREETKSPDCTYLQCWWQMSLKLDVILVCMIESLFDSPDHGHRH